MAVNTRRVLQYAATTREGGKTMPSCAKKAGGAHTYEHGEHSVVLVYPVVGHDGGKGPIGGTIHLHSGAVGGGGGGGEREEVLERGGQLEREGWGRKRTGQRDEQ